MVHRTKVAYLTGLVRKLLTSFYTKVSNLFKGPIQTEPPLLPMRLPRMFDERKTAQMAAFLLAKEGGRMAHLKLMKLLYLADRESLHAAGQQISGDRMVSMKHGLVLSETLNLMDGDVESCEMGWNHWVSSKENYELKLVREAPQEAFTKLSRAEISVLEAVWAKFGHMTKWEIRDYTHTLPEWVDPHGSSMTVNRANIFESFGETDEQIKSSMLILEENTALDKAVAFL